jgi:hypothetical protein
LDGIGGAAWEIRGVVDEKKSLGGGAIGHPQAFAALRLEAATRIVFLE